MNKKWIYYHELIGEYPYKNTDLIYFFEWIIKSKPNSMNHGYYGTIHSFHSKIMFDYTDEIEILQQIYLCTGEEQNEYTYKKNMIHEIIGS